MCTYTSMKAQLGHRHDAHVKHQGVSRVNITTQKVTRSKVNITTQKVTRSRVNITTQKVTRMPRTRRESKWESSAVLARYSCNMSESPSGSRTRTLCLSHQGSRTRTLCLSHQGSRTRTLCLSHQGSRTRTLCLSHQGSRTRTLCLSHQGSRTRMSGSGTRTLSTPWIRCGD